MELLATSGWRWVVLSAAFGAAVAAPWAAEVPEAKGKVTFSDAGETQDGRRVDVAVPTPMFQRNLDTSRGGGSSLDGVRAMPFAPAPSLSTGVLSRRDRDARSNWILDPGKRLAISEENANRAFGVRSGAIEAAEEDVERPSNFWEAYFNKEKAEGAKTRSTPLSESPSRENARGESLRRFQPFEPFGASEFENPLRFSGSREGNGVLFSDTPSRTPILGNLGDALETNTRRDLVRDSLSFTPSTPGPKLETGATARAEQFRRMLGIESPGDPKPAASWAAGATAIVETDTEPNPRGAVDLLAVPPDPTRMELNPVVARPAPEFDGSSKLGFFDPIGGLNQRPATQRRSLIDMAPMRSVLPAAASSADRGVERSVPRTIYSPTTLEMPGRSF